MTKKYTKEQIKEAEESAIFYQMIFGEEITAKEILDTEKKSLEKPQRNQQNH